MEKILTEIRGNKKKAVSSGSEQRDWILDALAVGCINGEAIVVDRATDRRMLMAPARLKELGANAALEAARMCGDRQ
ncbi:MAG: hypothetical protein K2Q10_00620 [Rhodospirillales bacterium]|nr:hypothetical protein [Rhodospirillales bacterium]